MKTLLLAREAASYLRVSEKTLANWRWQGTGPRWLKSGGRVVYDRADLDGWLDASQSLAG